LKFLKLLKVLTMLIYVIFQFAHTNFRGHCYKLFKPLFSTNIGKVTFVNRVVEEWNKLPVDVVSCDTVLNFKMKLDGYLRFGRGLI